MKTLIRIKDRIDVNGTVLVICGYDTVTCSGLVEAANELLFTLQHHEGEEVTVIYEAE